MSDTLLSFRIEYVHLYSEIQHSLSIHVLVDKDMTAQHTCVCLLPCVPIILSVYTSVICHS
jgi:hypothetical protein